MNRVQATATNSKVNMKLFAICIGLSVLCLAFGQNQTDDNRDDPVAPTETSTAAALAETTTTESTPARLDDSIGGAVNTPGNTDSSVGRPEKVASDSDNDQCDECASNDDADSTATKFDVDPNVDANVDAKVDANVSGFSF